MPIYAHMHKHKHTYTHACMCIHTQALTAPWDRTEPVIALSVEGPGFSHDLSALGWKRSLLFYSHHCFNVTSQCVWYAFTQSALEFPLLGSGEYSDWLWWESHTYQCMKTHADTHILTWRHTAIQTYTHKTQTHTYLLYHGLGEAYTKYYKSLYISVLPNEKSRLGEVVVSVDSERERGHD